MIQQLLWRADNERALPQLKMLLYIRFYYVMCRHMIKNVTPIVVAPRKRRRRRGRSWPIVRKYIQSRAQNMAILYLFSLQLEAMHSGSNAYRTFFSKCLFSGPISICIIDGAVEIFCKRDLWQGSLVTTHQCFKG